MTYTDSPWWQRLEHLATVGPEPDDLEEAKRFIEEADAMTAAAKALLHPGALTPAKRQAQLMKYPVTPKR